MLKTRSSGLAQG